MNKFFSHIIAGLVPDKQLRRRVRNLLLSGSDPVDDLCNQQKQLLEQQRQEIDLLRNDGFMHFNGIIDLDGGFKRYFLKNNIPEKTAILKRGLDKRYQDNIDLYLERMVMIPDGSLASKYYKVAKKFWESLHTEEEKKFLAEYSNYLGQWQEEFVLPEDIPHENIFYNSSVVLFSHGLRFASQKLKEYIAEKDFIDGGAYIGDSTLMLAKHYNPKKVYAFEISDINKGHFLDVMKINRIPDNKFELVSLGLSDSKKIAYIKDAGTPGTHVKNQGDTRIELTDLDSFVKERMLKVGFLKSDVEGVGYDALKGMLETIKSDRPVMSLAIYHTPQEFFEMKPLLEETVQDLNYKITIERFHLWPDFLGEITMFAYPKELE